MYTKRDQCLMGLSRLIQCVQNYKLWLDLMRFYYLLLCRILSHPFCESSPRLLRLCWSMLLLYKSYNLKDIKSEGLKLQKKSLLTAKQFLLSSQKNNWLYQVSVGQCLAVVDPLSIKGYVAMAICDETQSQQWQLEGWGCCLCEIQLLWLGKERCCRTLTNLDHRRNEEISCAIRKIPPWCELSQSFILSSETSIFRAF